jgi:GT2 family glycosyltransferase/lipopolysaccharide/colanic/teichoic acid biosynthesis glycosyltransferase
LTVNGAPPTFATETSVVIVHYRTPDLLRNCLSSLRGEIDAGLEVVVVDNDSGPLRPDWLATEFPTVSLLAQPRNVGYSRAVNLGIQSSRGVYVLILNPDIVVHPGAVDALVRSAIANPEVGIVAPKLLNPDGTLQHSCRRFYDLQTFVYRRTFLGKLRPNSTVLRRHMMLDFDHAGPRVVDWVLGGAMLVRRAAVDEVGGMDERFFLYFEDVDWCYRMHRRGWRVLYDPAAVMVHHHRRDSARKPLGKSFFSHLMSVVRFYEKWSLLLYLFKTQREEIGRSFRLLVDVVAVNLAFIGAFVIRASLGQIFEKPVFEPSSYRNFWLFGNALSVGTLYLLGSYRPEPRGRDWVDRLFAMTRAAGIVTVIMMATTFLLQTQAYSRAMLLAFWPLASVFLLLGRQAVSRFAASVRGQRLDLPRVAVVGSRDAVSRVRSDLADRSGVPFEPVYLPNYATGRSGSGGEEAERIERIVEFARAERIASVYFVSPAADAALVIQLVPRLARAGVRSLVRPEIAPVLNPSARVEDLGGTWVVALGTRTRWRASGIGKRAFDLAASGLLLLLGAPANVAFVTWRALGKVRPLWTVEERWVREGTPERYSLYHPRPRGNLLSVVLFDHYPRLLAVWRGEFSFVGVYPFRSEEFQALSPEMRSLSIEARPGLTGLWWFYRGGGFDADRMRALDVEYVQQWSNAYDLKTFLRALTALVRTRGHLPDFLPEEAARRVRESSMIRMREEHR